MGVFTDSIQKYAPILEKVFGGINDLVVKNRYEDAELSLQKMRDAKIAYDRFNKINKRLRSTVIPPNELYKPSNDYDFNTTNELLNSTTAANKFYETLPKVQQTAEDGTTTETVQQVSGEDFKKWLAANPEYFKELQDLKYIKPKYEELNDDERRDLVYKKAGLTPEELQFYNEFKKQNFDITDHNTKLQNLILDYVPGLTSRGTEGDRLAKLFQTKAGLLGIDDGKNTKYSYINLKDGKMLRYADDGSYEIVEYGDGEKDMKSNPEKWQVEERNGEYYYAYDQYDPKTGSSELKLIRKLTETEKSNYLAEKEAADIKLDKLKNPNKYRTRSSSRSNKKKIEKTPYDSILKVMSDIGLKNSGKNWEDWDKPAKQGGKEGKDKVTYTNAMNKLRELTKKSDQEIWNMVGDFEKRIYGGNKELMKKMIGKDIETTIKEIEKTDYDLTDEAQQLEEMYEEGKITQEELLDYLYKLDEINNENREREVNDIIKRQSDRDPNTDIVLPKRLKERNYK